MNMDDQTLLYGNNFAITYVCNDLDPDDLWPEEGLILSPSPISSAFDFAFLSPLLFRPLLVLLFEDFSIVYKYVKQKQYS